MYSIKCNILLDFNMDLCVWQNGLDSAGSRCVLVPFCEHANQWRLLFPWMWGSQNYITQNIKSHMIMTLNCHRWKRSSWISHFWLLKHLARCYPLCQTCERLGIKQIWIRKKIADTVSGIKNGQRSMRSAHCIHYYYI